MLARHYDDDQGETIDNCSRIGAQRLAERIVAFWRAKGFPSITAGVVATTIPQRRTGELIEVYKVISNIGPRGFPPAVPLLPG